MATELRKMQRGNPKLDRRNQLPSEREKGRGEKKAEAFVCGLTQRSKAKKRKGKGES